MFFTGIFDLFKWSRGVQPETNLEASKPTPSDSADPVDLSASVEKAFTYATAQGSIGDVWKCQLNGNDNNPEPVAVKCVRIDIPDETFKVLVSERLMDNISKWKQFDHESVLPLFGITYNFGPVPAIVSPWMDNGSLTTFLERHPNLGETARLGLLADVAAGLQYLHSKDVPHADLTGNNVLVDSNGRARIADYGLSTIYADLNGTSYIRHNVRWVAPELFEVPDTDDTCPPKLQSDIYSFGCIIYQVLSGLQPYYDVRSDHQVVVAILRGIKPKRPSVLPIRDHHWDIIEQCWLGISERPSISDVRSLMDHHRRDD